MARTVPFKPLLDEVATRRGLDPSTNLTPAEAAALASHITAAYRTAYDFYHWPDSIRQLPDYTLTDGFIPWVLGSDGEIISEMLSITDVDPEKERSPVFYPFTMTKDGFQIRDPWPETAHLRFRPTHRGFTATAFDPALSYPADSLVLYTDGYCYWTPAAQSPGSVPSDTWTESELLYTLREAVKSGAVALSLEEEGQSTAANYVNGHMDDYLSQEILKQERAGQKFRDFAFAIPQ